ncbi:MAG: hypothetical protein ABIJ34_00320 [archaeon]
MDKTLFVGVYEPVDVRRNILEASKEIVGTLQTHEKLENLRKQKLVAYQQMKDLVSELDLLVGRLKKALPRSDMRKAIEKPQAAPVSTDRNSPAEMRKLEEQLKKIEKEFSQIKL